MNETTKGRREELRAKLRKCLTGLCLKDCLGFTQGDYQDLLIFLGEPQVREYIIKYHRRTGSRDYRKTESFSTFSSSVIVSALDAEDAVKKFPYQDPDYVIDEASPRFSDREETE